jgi:AraC-like DNA-binding protein
MPEEACFVYVLKGKSNTFSDISSELILEKEAVLMKCGQYFFRFQPAEATNTYEAIAVHFYPDVLRKVYATETPTFLKIKQADFPKSGMAKLRASEILDKYFEHILFYFDNPALATEDMLILKLKELVLLLNNTENAAAVRAIFQNLFTPVTHDFREVVEAHLYSDLSVEELAKLANCSLSSFKRTFREIYNDSPGRYMKHKKLAKAADLLRLSEEPVSSIAYQCGSHDLPNFTVSFKARYGCTPSAYRGGKNL